MNRRWKLLVASLLTVGVTGSVWAGEGEGERVRIQTRVLDQPCSSVAIGEEGADGIQVRKRGFLGVELTQLTSDLRRHFGVPEDLGVMIGKIVDDSAAFRAGLAVGDIITKADDTDVDGPWELTSVIRRKGGGDVLDLEYWREGKVYQASVTLDEKEGCVFDLGSSIHHLKDLGEHFPGVTIEHLKIGEDAMHQAMEALKNIDWDEHLKHLDNIDVDVHIEEQMEHLQERMREIEERLSLETEEFERKMEKDVKDREKALRDHHKSRIRAEKEARKDMVRAQQEARRAMMEARRAQAEAMREASEERREAVREAAEEAAEAAREAAEEAAEEGGGSILI